MREWKVIIPVNKYNMAPGRHFVGAMAETSNAITTADFYLYNSPDDSYVPNKTIRYFSGRYGDDEIIPTPTPIIVTQIVTQVVTQIVTVPVTPSNDQVYAQQKKAQEATFGEYARMGFGGLLGACVIGGSLWYAGTIARRLRRG